MSRARQNGCQEHIPLPTLVRDPTLTLRWLSSLISLLAGYVGFHPPRPHQIEETLTESNVKNGLVLPPAVPVRPHDSPTFRWAWFDHTVQAETYSAQDSVRKRLMQEDALGELEDLMNQIFARKADTIPPIPLVKAHKPPRPHY